jgi:hypothetical protein
VTCSTRGTHQTTGRRGGMLNRSQKKNLSDSHRIDVVARCAIPREWRS